MANGLAEVVDGEGAGVSDIGDYGGFCEGRLSVFVVMLGEGTAVYAVFICEYSYKDRKLASVF